MNEEQAEKIIKLLESIDNKLDSIKSENEWIRIHTSNIEANTDN
ncbi:hypothetical protein [Pseudoneobacillus sp. C159]